MTRESRRLFGLLPALTLFAAFPLAWFAAPGQAEERKFVVLLTDLPKDHPGGGIALPNRNNVWDAYFDKAKNAEPGDPGVRVDSFAEWWEEASYGDVTVTGDVYGWVSLPWPSRPPGFDGDTSFQGSGVMPHVDLNGSRRFELDASEGYTPVQKYDSDYDGTGANFFAAPLPNEGAGDQFQWGFYLDLDPAGVIVYAPGERFLDLNGNRVYDAGVHEWGIDKNGDGEIDDDKRASSWAQLVGASVTYSEDDDIPPVFNGWNNDTEWFDSNGDGEWNLDGFSFPVLYDAGTNVVIWRGDWGGREIWIDRNGDFELGDRAEPEDPDAAGRPWATFYEFIIQVHDPEEDGVEYFDQQWNDNYDFAEPFEDYLRRWEASAHGGASNGYIRTSLEYIAFNYPGDVNRLIARIGNSRYDPPNGWANGIDDDNSNKLQLIARSADIANAEDATEKDNRENLSTPEPAWYQDWWAETFGTTPPQWRSNIPYLRKFDPGDPFPRLNGDTEDRRPPFDPDRGGPYGSGRRFDGNKYTRDDGTILPNISDRLDGMYDGPPEFLDLPSSIYHKDGDLNFGEVTSPSGTDVYGHDIGPGVSPDGQVVAGGPPAIDVHGDGGFDAGNVLNLEYLTWRTNGQGLADTFRDFDGDGLPDRFSYHRDINLDGLLDLGETPGDRGDYGAPDASYSNYGIDLYAGTAPNGGPWSDINGAYPFNRLRLIEDAVAALDESVDWDDYLGGPGQFGSAVSGVILTPAGTADGMFKLPAAVFPFSWFIQTRDQENPIPFFDGLGTALDGAGEGDIGTEGGAGAFQTGFAIHEYCHLWEGYPDLYDYDVYRQDFPGVIINNPIGGWCIMAGGLVHPVPVLKADSGWIEPIDIATALIPAGETTLSIRSWEFDRDKNVFVYKSPLFPGEQFWFWRTSAGVRTGGQLTKLSFNRFAPGEGLIIMHVDAHAGSIDPNNPESLPTQQRLESHFTYNIVQADGLQQLDAGENSGDDGDPWPGSTNATKWDRNTDPNNRWYANAQGSGLNITNIVHQANSTLVTFRWLPQELPTLVWVQPPGGISVNGRYPLRFTAYDQYGGTRLDFFASRSTPGAALTYDNGVSVGPQTGKTPGQIEGVYQANVGSLEDGTYTFYARLTPGVGSDGNIEHWNSTPRGNFNNVGNGSLTVNGVDSVISRLERWTATVISDQPTGGETWRVEGTLSGVQANVATTGVPYNSDIEIGSDGVGRSALSFTILASNIPFRNDDQFIFLTTGLTPHSSAVLVDTGEVVQPQPPIAVARVENGKTSGLAPLDVVFRHDQSSDPHNAALTYVWDFDDGSPLAQTNDPAAAVPHTFTVPSGLAPYVVTLTVTNAFGLSDTDSILMQVNEAAAPTVRATADPLAGLRPLTVHFTGDLTTDPNPGTQQLDYVWDFGDGSPLVTTPNVSHLYTDAGVYRATLTVTNRPYNKSSSEIIEIRVKGPAADQPPVAAFEVDRRFGQSPLTVLFDASRSADPEGGPLEYIWNFGDGAPIERGVSVIEHTYTRARTYNATLTVVDDSQQSDSATLAIVVTGDGSIDNGAPVARIVASATQGPAPFTVAFDAGDSVDPQGGPLGYAWDFGDGSEVQSGQFVTHTFTAPRRYSVVLVVSDETGATGAATISILVTSASGDDSGRVNIEDVVPELANCGGASCGPVGLLPVSLTMLGIVGLRRVGRRMWP